MHSQYKYQYKYSIFFTSLLAIVLLPSAYQKYFESSSMALGLVISSLLIFFYYFYKQKYDHINRILTPFFWPLVLIFFISIYSMLIHDEFSNTRFLLSYFITWVLLLASFYFVKISLKVDDNDLYKYISSIFYVLLFDGILVCAKKALSLGNHKDFLFFTEPSHFAIIFLPFLLFKVLTYKKNYQIYSILLISLFLVVYLKNLTLLVGIISIILLLSFKKSLIMFLLFVITTILINPDNYIYFLDRLSATNTNNVSLIVFLSGWESAYINLFGSNLFGIGFQQLGFLGTDGFYRDKLISMNLGTVNLYDGGTTGSKLISELGLLGLFLIVQYLRYMIKMISIVRRNTPMTYLDTFYYSVFILAFVSLFIRGTGYFSPIIFLLICSIIYLKINKNNIYKFADANTCRLNK